MARKKASGDKGKRLSVEQKDNIAAAGNSGATLAEIAKEFSVSIPTVRRIVGPRRGAKAAAARAVSTTARNGGAAKTAKLPGGVSVTVDGDELVIRMPRKHLLKQIVGDLLS